MQAADLLIWGIVIGLISMFLITKKMKRIKIQKMLKRAKTAEKKAITFLKKAGYTIIDIQLKEDVTIFIDDKAHTSTIRADLLVRKGWKRYIVEVKTGNQTSATLPNVRRQLLEYHLVYKPDGVLLLDMEKEKLKRIRFDYTYDRVNIGNVVIIGMIGVFLGYLLSLLKI